MKRTKSTASHLIRRTYQGALAILSGWAMTAGAANYTVTWKDTATSGWWAAGDGDENRWYRFDDGWDVRREDLDWNQWSSSGTKNYNHVVFANGNQATMTVNAQGGAQHYIASIWFSNSTSRTFAQDGGAFLMLSSDGTPKIEAASGSGTGTYTFNVPIQLAKTTEFNPVGGNLTFNAAITNGGNWINVYGNVQKTLTIGGVLSGGGGIANKQDNIVVLTNNNTFTGAIWVEKGTVQLGGHTNAIGASGIANVGTNATLDISGYGAVGVRPTTLNLYGTGTNAAWGALRKTTSGATAWRGNINLGADSKIVVTAGGIGLYGAVTAATHTLYITNTTAITMFSGSTLSGSKTTGDGALHKSGSSILHLRPASGLTGSIWLNQGEIRQYTDNNSTIPAGGIFRMSAGTTYRSDGTSRTNAKATQIDGNVTLGHSGGGELTLSGSMNLTAGQRTLTTDCDVAILGAVTNGGLTKAGSGKLTLSGANTYALGTLVSAGTLEGTTTSLQGNITNNSAVIINQTANGTYSGVISGTGTLTKQGSGTATLSGVNTFSGNTTVSAGTLLVSGSANSSAVTVSSGATLAGAGSVGAISSLAGTISPGNSAGARATLSCGALTLADGGGYTFDISNVSGSAGTEWDLVSGSGVLTVNAAGTFTIFATGNPTGFDSGASYTWTIMSGSSVSGFNASRFAVDTSGFTPGLDGGSFSVANSGANLQLVFTPAPPPTPAGFSASDGTSTAHVALSWTDGARETGYVIWRHTADVPASATAIYTNAANTTTYNDTSAAEGQLYYYWVSATNSGGSSAKSTVDTGYRKLATVSITGATDGTHLDKVAVTWTDITGETGYGIWRDTDSDPAGGAWAGTAAANATSFDDTTATPGQLYHYWVRATNSTSASMSDYQVAGETGYRKLPTVAGVDATDNSSAHIQVTWTDSDAGETGYTVWRHTADTSGSATLISGAPLGADATSYNDTTATAGVDYWYWVRATNSTSASMSDFSASAQGLKLLAQPDTAASNITFSDLAHNAYTVGWTRGDGDYVLVVAKQGSAPTAPTASTVYGADPNFGDGDETAAGSYVVYKGTGTSVPVTGLSAATEYYFAVYEFNGDTAPAYRTSDAPVASRFTLAAEPATQASSIAIGNPLEVSMTGFTWTDGNGTDRLLVMKAGGPVDSVPVDGTGYTHSTNFGSGSQIGTGNYVVWSGAGQPDRISSLTRDVVYHFRLFEFNGSGATANYNTNTASGNPISQTTMAGNPGSAPTDLALSSIGPSQFTVTWTLGTTSTNTLIVVRAGANPSGPTDMNSYDADPVFGDGDDLGSGSYVVYTNTGTSVTVTGLTPGERYYVRAYAFNGTGGAENYRTSDFGSIDGYTLMPEPTQATAITFGTLGSTSYAVSYTAGNGLSRLVVAKQGGAVDWTPTDGTAYAGENNAFGSGTELSAGNFLVHRGASPFTLSGLTAATDYHIRIFEYQGTNDTLNYNTSAAAGNPSNRYALSTEPTGHAATFTATAASDTEIDLDWGAATGESGFLILRKAGSSPTGTPADGTAYSQGDALGDGTVVFVNTTAGANSTTDSYSTSAGTTYYYKIFPYAYDGTPANATYNYYTGGTVPSANATTGSAEPASSSSITSFLPASGTSATIVWTNTGSADGTIILVKSGGAVDANPADWNGYTADAAFGDGDELGTGNFVVFAAAGKHGSVEVTGLSAGTTYHAAVYPYNGTASFLNYRTASPGTASVTILPNPSVATATADGKTLIDLAWTKHASYNVMIVHRTGSPSTAPTQGTGYNAGDSVGGGTVIYKGAGAALEHVVASGTAHHYAFYSYDGSSYYSSGLTDTESTTSFGADDVVETFSYTNSTVLTGLNGETGWGGAWYGNTGSATNSSGSFADQTNYPAPSGNKLFMHPADNSSLAVYRPLGQSYNSGRLYFGYVLNYQWDGADKYAGLSLFETNSSEKLFIGEIYGQNQQLGIDSTGSSYTLTAGSGNDYIIVGYYDWGAAEAKARAFKIGTQAVPTDEPSTWDVTVSKASNTVGAVDTIRLAAGAGAGAGRPGDVYFDEVRIATNWSDLIGVLPTKPDWPTNQSATADGSEMARLAWTKNGAGNNVMILHKTTAISTDPSDGTGYSVGDTIDGARVVYKGAGTAVEHVVTPGTTNRYKFYSYSGANYYSTGVVASATNAAYSTYERVNPFSYTNDTAFGTSMVGGQGFGANYWVANSGTWKARTNNAVAVTDDVPMFLDMDGYPEMAGNLAWVADPGNGGSATADRDLASGVTTGNFYVAFMMSYQYYGANKWAGLSLMNGGTEKAFFGKGGGGNWHTLAAGGDGTTYWSAFDLLPYHSSGGDTGNVYLVVGHYNFESKLLRTKAWKIIGGEFPEDEPSTWDASGTLGTGIDAINRIRLNVGSSDGGATIGKVYFDEIRYGTSWSDLLAVTCPSWAGSNTLNGVEWTSPESTWLGDYDSFLFQSWPVSVGQSGGIEIDWGRDGSFSTYQDLPWLQNANNNSYWSNQIQMVTAGVITSRFVAAGSGCAEVRTNNPALTVQNLNPPTDATATRDGVNTNSQINLEWVRGVSGGAKDVLIVRQTADSGWTAPVNGATYNGGDSLGSGTVVYRGAGTTHSDTGLAPDTTYYYRFYSENWTYYSVTYDEANASTATGSQEIVIDGNPADWVGSPSTVINSAASSLQEFIWTDKRGEVRVDSGDHPNADISEFRVFADSDWVYFLVKMTNITDATKPYLAIGVDTRRDSGSASMNWLGDDSGTFIGDGYFGSGGAVHFPEYQINVHHANAAGGARIELYAHDGTFWYAPPTGGNTNVAISTANNAIELKVARADLNLTGAVTGRFTVASYLNTGAWNNDGDGTVQLAENTADAADSVSIAPWNTTDNSLTLSAWLEDISDADIDFWLDVKFAAGGLSDNSRPSTPTLVSPTNNAGTTASPNLIWNSSTDSDGQVTGYLLEISTNEQFNGVTGTENGTIQLRMNLPAATTNYMFTTTASQYWWRVRARDTAGQLSTATTHTFRVVGKLDTEGPRPTLLYIGTNVAGYLAGQYDARIAQYGPIQSVLDSEIGDTNNVFGFVLRWEDPSGVYATNRNWDTGGFAYNIVDTDGRVSPNWDLVEIDTVGGTTNDLWGVDRPFYASNTLATGNSDVAMTNYVVAAFNVTNYDPSIEYYLTVSAEDAYTEGGSWWANGTWPSYVASGAAEPYYSGWCADGPNTARNITTNFLIRINVRDDDIIPPQASTNLGWANTASMVVSNTAGALDYVSGTGQEVLYEVTDGDLIGEPLTFSFNAYDSFYKGIALGTTATYEEHSRTLTNTSFVAAYWQTNWANYSAAMSDDADTTDPDTRLVWHWANITTQDVTALWGPDSLSGEMGVTNLIQLNLRDVDNDREGDQAVALANFGRIRLVDDDSDPPVIDPDSLQVTGTGLASEYRLENLVVWDFTGASGDPAKLVSTNVAAGVTSSPVSLGPSGSIIGTDVITVSAGFATGADRYWLFSLTPATTAETFKATSISFDSRVSSLNGPDRWELYGTMPGGSETLWAQGDIDLSDPDNPIGTNWNGYSEGLAMPAAATNTVLFKLRAYVADTNHLTGTGTATWSVDNLTLSGYILGAAGGTQVTDRDLAQGTVRFEALMHDEYSGLYASTQSGRAPRVDFWFADGVPVTNVFFTNGLSANGDATTATTVWGYAPAANKQAIQGGRNPTNYTARFKAEDFDADRDGDSLVTTNTLANVLVYDNDTNAPARGFKYGSPLGVFVDNTITKAVSSGFTREYRINDEQLQAMAATSITVKINLYDFSGWEVPTLLFTNAVDGVIATNGWLEGLYTDSVDTTNNPDAEMVWTLGKAQAETFFNDYESVVNVFRIASVWDKDNDRHDSEGNNIDNKELANARIGHLTFLDNDVGLPNLQSSWSVARTNWNIPKIYLGLPGDAGASNVLINADVALPDTNAAASIAILTNRVYDSQLAKVTADAPLSVVLPTFDTGGGGAGRTVKGVQRGTTLTQESVNTGYDITNSWVGIGTVRVQNASAYRADLSSTIADTRIAARFPTSTWAFTEFSYEQVGHFLNAGETSMGHAMTSGLFDADDNRPNDQTFREVAFGTLLVLDNDTVAPIAPSNVTVNGADTSGGFDRFTAPWTNQPEFRVGFAPAVDGDPGPDDLEATGIGEHRVATDKSGIGPNLGTALAVPAESSLANYGFESGSTNWTLTGAEISTEQAYEGLYSLKMTGSTAVQTVPLVNTNGYVPRVTVVAVQYMGATDGTLTIDGLDDQGDLVVGETFDVDIIGSAGEWVEGSSAATSLDSTVDQIRVTLTSGAGTYWDDVRVQIELLDGGSPVDEVTSIFSATEQGLVTNYLFAVDRDNNRPGDRLASSAPADPDIPSFITAYDITPPTRVPMPANAASTDTVDDPTTQFDIEWTTTGVGPDDEGDGNYPAGYSGTDVLSPWRTYKVYYGVFDPVDVPSDDPGHGNGDAYIYTNFITSGAYTNWTSISSTNTIADPSAAGTNYLALTNLSQNAIRLHDLDFDQDYAVVIVGVDRAGNEGAAGPESWTTNNTIRFAVTQGVMRARTQIESAFPTNNNLRTGDKGAAGLFWIAAGPTNAQGGYTQVNKEYDLIYYDSGFFNETATTVWHKVGTVQSNWFTDAEAQDFGRGTVRFYRASYKDRWRRTNVVSGLDQRPLASEDVYALHNVVISEGYNHVALHGLPFTNTFAGVFGTDTNFWPAGVSAGAGATKVEFYSPGSNAPVSEVYFFGIDGNWYQAGNPTPVTSALQSSNFFMRGFSLTLPAPLPTNYVTTTAYDFDNATNVAAMVWRPILKVPTTNGPAGGGFSHTIHCGQRRPNLVSMYNVVGLNLPVSAHPSQMNLLESGFVKEDDAQGDWIYTLDTTQKRVRDGSTIYCDTAGVWRFVTGDGTVPAGYFKPNDMIVIWSFRGGVGNTWEWTYHPTNFYNLPTRWMGE
jgi:autotransporter-associated beta strand protein